MFYVFLIPIRKNLVLIDTWWNVNKDEQVSLLSRNSVLIDTWWNVNISCVLQDVKTFYVLIDTWWNVNSILAVKWLK